MDSGKKNKGLRRELGLLDIFCIASGAMISSGLFILPAFIRKKRSNFLKRDLNSL